MISCFLSSDYAEDVASLGIEWLETINPEIIQVDIPEDDYYADIITNNSILIQTQ